MENKRIAFIETILTAMVALLVLVIIWSLLTEDAPTFVPIIAIIGLVLVGYAILRFAVNPARLRATQADRTLSLASSTLSAIHEGLNSDSADEVCRLLLPYSAALAVSITDKERILAYAGFGENLRPAGEPIKTKSTLLTLSDGQTRVLMNPAEIGIPDMEDDLRAAIISPLRMGNKVVGTLKFYYHSSRKLDETQQSMAKGLAQLLSTQLTAAEVDAQTELATRMELKALQSQINPHFLFNTINTIASLIRTDPNRARELLREFAVFYRRTLENSKDLIAMNVEIEQTERYFQFVLARFGEERIELKTSMEPGLESLRVPSFIIQPIVENSVNHAMRDEGQVQFHRVQLVPTRALVIVADRASGVLPISSSSARC